ncbi:MAG: RNA pseudouridine synthase [Rhabdochlamydiaceae bacterium]|nr:RNA pseudouridine synthase [Candidatus Amphrikana amoebophyrae]
MNIIFHDNHLLVVEKEAGLLTQPTELCQDSLETRVKAWLQKELNKEVVFLKTVHRLDKGVSGLVIFTRSSKATARMSKLIKDQKIKKTYFTEVEGLVKKDSGTLTHFLEKKEFIAKVYDIEQFDTKEAILNYTVLKRNESTSVLKVELITGRYHQIRAQLSYIGHPIVGDQKYGAKFKQANIHLRHSILEFIHPVTQKLLRLQLPDTGF